MELVWKAIQVGSMEHVRNRPTRVCALVLYGTLCRSKMPRSRSFGR